LSPTPPDRIGALILTGGASSRMGTDKACLDWNGARAVDLCAALAAAIGADPVVTVGRRSLGYPHVSDETPLAGPVGGIVTGARALIAAGCRRALVLAVDAPTIRPDDLAALLAAPDPGAAFADVHLPMLLELARLPADAAPGWPIRRLVAVAGLAWLAPRPDQAARLRGANTPAERDGLLVGCPSPAREESATRPTCSRPGRRSAPRFR
jgi:molybdopterin-guanine dinucleotide biosynthesis protein A